MAAEKDTSKQTEVLLELSRQHLQRTSELENLEWRMNFSLWALLAGLAYLVAEKPENFPASIRGGCAILLGLTLVVVFHSIAVILLNRQRFDHVKICKDHRQSVVDLSGLKYEYRAQKFITLRYVVWFVWEVGVTILIASVIFILIRSR